MSMLVHMTYKDVHVASGAVASEQNIWDRHEASGGRGAG